MTDEQKKRVIVIKNVAEIQPTHPNDKHQLDQLQTVADVNPHSNSGENCYSPVKNSNSSINQQLVQNGQSFQVNRSIEQSISEACEGSSTSQSTSNSYCNSSYSESTSSCCRSSSLESTSSRFGSSRSLESASSYCGSSSSSQSNASYCGDSTLQRTKSFCEDSILQSPPSCHKKSSTVQSISSPVRLFDQSAIRYEWLKVLYKLNKGEFPEHEIGYVCEDLAGLEAYESHISLLTRVFYWSKRERLRQLLSRTLEIINCIDEANIYLSESDAQEKGYPKDWGKLIGCLKNIRLNIELLKSCTKIITCCSNRIYTREYIYKYLHLMLTIIITIKHVQETIDNIEPFKHSVCFHYSDRFFLLEVLDKRDLYEKLLFLLITQCDDFISFMDNCGIS